MPSYQGVRQAIHDLVAPRLESLKGEMAAMRGEMRGEFSALRSEIAAVRTEVHALDERLTLALDLRERIVAIEARLRS